MRHVRPITICLLVLFCALSAQAVTYFVPSDREMIQQSDDIVIATGVTSVVERNERGGIVTRTTLRIEEVLKGERLTGEHLVLTQSGGVLGDEASYIPGTPTYEPGARYVVFTATDRDGNPTTYGLSLGRFAFADRALVRSEVTGFDQNLEPHREGVRDARRFVSYVRDVVARRGVPAADYFLKGADAQRAMESQARVTANAFTRGSYLMRNGAIYFRWENPVATIVKSGTQPGVNADSAVTKAFGQWNGTNSDIDYKDGGQDNTATDGLDRSDSKNAILFNDPNNEISNTGCPNCVAGIGGISRATGTYTLDGETFARIQEIDVVMNNTTFAQNCFNGVMTHELGHTLGFRHSNQNNDNDAACASPLECTTTAIMNSSVQCGFDGVIKTWDKNAATAVYGDPASPPPCEPAAITSQPPNRSITSGKSTTLSVTATGTAPLTYQWFVGAPGETGLPVADSNKRSIEVAPLVTTVYWVRVTGSCGDPASSAAATVTVSACPTIAVTAVAAAPVNNIVTLTANTTATDVTYQWFKGNTPGSGGVVAGSKKSIDVDITPNATSYWVRITNGCGNTAFSELVTVAACSLPQIQTQPVDVTIAQNGTAQLAVALAGAGTGTTVTWYRGTAPDKTAQVGTGLSFTTSALTATTSFWAAVKNTCGEIQTRTVVVTVETGPVCVVPTVTLEPLSQEAKAGAVELTVTASGTAPFTYQWYEGAALDTSKPVGTNAATLSLTGIKQATSYWVRITNTCGTIDSAVAAITVPPPARPGRSRAVRH